MIEQNEVIPDSAQKENSDVDSRNGNNHPTERRRDVRLGE